MIHELLVAMAGHPGDVFVPYPAAPLTATTFAVRPDFPLLHPAERASLNRLTRLGFWCQRLTQFSDRSAHVAVTLGGNSGVPSPGAVRLYTEGLAIGVRAVLADYHKLLDEVETKILRRDEDAEGRTPIASLLATFSEDRIDFACYPFLKTSVVLETVDSLIQEYQAKEESDYYGCRVLDLVLGRTHDGRAHVARAMHQLARGCLCVFVRHLAGYLLEATAYDPSNEFFLTIDREAQEQAQSTKTCLHFRIEETQLPALVPRGLAQAILFTVTSTYIVKRSPKHGELLPPSTRKRMMQNLSGVLLGNTMDEPIRTLDLALAIDLVRNDATRALWKIVVLDEKLLEYLQAIRQVYLHERGDLMDHLLAAYERLEVLVAARASSLTERELNYIWHATVAQLGESESLIAQFQFRVWQIPHSNVPESGGASPGSPRVDSASDPDFPFRAFRHVGAGGVASYPGTAGGEGGGGARVHLHLPVPWPLCLIVTEQQLTSYSRVFQVLAHLRRTLVRVAELQTPLRGAIVCSKAVVLSRAGGAEIARARLVVLHALRTLLEYFSGELDGLFGDLVKDLSHSANSSSTDKSRSHVSTPQSRTRSPPSRTTVDESVAAEPSERPNGTLPAADSPGPVPSPGNESQSTAPRMDLHEMAQRHASFVASIERLLFLGPGARLLRDTLGRLLDVAERFAAASERAIDSIMRRARHAQDTRLGNLGGPRGALDRVPPELGGMVRDRASAQDEDFLKEMRFFMLTLEGVRSASSAAVPVHRFLLRADFNTHWSLGPMGPGRDHGDQDLRNPRAAPDAWNAPLRRDVDR